jgi:uncharacterized membrane protein YesL
MVLTRSMIKNMDDYTFEEYHPVYKRNYTSNNVSYSEMVLSVFFIGVSSSLYYYMVINSIVN